LALNEFKKTFNAGSIKVFTGKAFIGNDVDKFQIVQAGIGLNFRFLGGKGEAFFGLVFGGNSDIAVNFEGFFWGFGWGFRQGTILLKLS
jgi:hypothetical protein